MTDPLWISVWKSSEGNIVANVKMGEWGGEHVARIEGKPDVVANLLAGIMRIQIGQQEPERV